MSSVANTQKFLEGLRIQGRSDDSLDTTADFTEDFSETTPTTWTEDSTSGYADNLEPYKSSTNGLWFDMDYTSSTKTSGTLDLANGSLVGSNVSDTQWTIRFKFHVTSGSGSGTIWIGLSDNAGASDVAQRFAGCRMKDSSGLSCGSDNSGQAMTVGNRTDGGTTTLSDDTDYYITVERQTANKLVVTSRTGSHTGTLVATTNATTLETATDDLRYFKVMNQKSSGSGNIRGYIYDLEIYDGTNTLTTAKDKSSITNVVEGTRYEEVDTRKIFRMATVPNVIIDFGAGGEATASNWTHPSTDSGGNSGAHGFSITTESSLTGSAGTIDITGRDWDSTIDMVTHCGLATAIPAQTKFVIDWDFYRHSDDTSDHPVFAFSSEAHGVDPRGGNSSKEVVWACEQNNQDDSGNDGQNSVKLYCKNSSGTSYGNTITVSGDSTSLQSKGETRYWRCIYGEDASTYLSVRLQRYDTAVNRTAGGSTGRELNLVSGGWGSSAGQTAWEAGDPIRYFTLLTYNNGQKAFSIDNITWYDDSLTAVANVPVWVEKGTA